MKKSQIKSKSVSPQYIWTVWSIEDAAMPGGTLRFDKFRSVNWLWFTHDAKDKEKQNRYLIYYTSEWKERYIYRERIRERDS